MKMLLMMAMVMPSCSFDVSSEPVKSSKEGQPNEIAGTSDAGTGTTDEQPAEGDGTEDETPDQSQVQTYYMSQGNRTLISRTQFKHQDSEKVYKYVMQVIVGKHENGSYRKPQFHIKQVDTEGKIGEDCLSLLVDPNLSSYTSYTTDARDKWPAIASTYYRTTDDTPGCTRSTNCTVSYGIEAYSWLYSKDECDAGDSICIVKIDMSFKRDNGSFFGHTMLAEHINDLTPAAQVASKASEWGITEDIAAAFGEGSNCIEKGHNRTCEGCILQ